MTCKKCGEKRHFCYSCGVEQFYLYYCSEACMDADGMKACEGCSGWGYDHDEDNGTDEWESPCDGKGYVLK